mgnify:CR=1 FL=1
MIVAGSAVVLAPSAVSATPSRVIDSESVGNYRITQSRTRAMDVFGAPTTSENARRFDRNGIPEREISFCITTWRPLGLIIRYLGDCSFTGRAYRVTVEGPGWRTREGLRIEDKASRITKIYRGARTTRGPSAAMYVRWTLMPLGVEAMGARVFHDFDAALAGADVVMMLRLQQERMSGQFIPSPREYRHLYGLTRKRLAKAAPDALVMHPGPMNRGVEIDSEVADLIDRSIIMRQVEMGVAIRMACLDVLTRTRRGVGGWA